MVYYSVLAVTPTSEDWIPSYLVAVNALVAKHGGRYLARTANHKRLEGEGEEVAQRVILEWPSKEAGLCLHEGSGLSPPSPSSDQRFD